MFTPIMVRWLLPSDVAAVRRLAQRSQYTPPRWTCRDLREFLTGGLNQGLVAEAEGRLLGFLLYTISVHDATLVVHQLAVAPNWRRQGVGRQFVAVMREFLRSNRWLRVEVLVHERNLPAQLFFRSTGFRAVVTRRACFADDGDGYLFELKEPQAKRR